MRFLGLCALYFVVTVVVVVFFRIDHTVQDIVYKILPNVQEGMYTVNSTH